jgi:hypothetical protein
VLFIRRSPGHTGLTGASHRSNQCKPCWFFARVNVWVCSLLSCVAAVSSLGRFGARLACLVFWGFLAETGQTGVLHRSDRCGAFLWKSPSFTNGDRSDRCWSVDSRFGVPLRSRVRMLCVGSEVQWHSSGYVGLANLGSESETCVGSRVHFVGVSISFEKNFYRLPFTPPSLVRRISPSSGIRAGSGLY